MIDKEIFDIPLQNLSAGEIIVLSELIDSVIKDDIIGTGKDKKLPEPIIELEDSGRDYARWYKDDPVGFIEDILGDTLTDDLKKICESVRDNQVTIAQSGNGTGKSFIAARIALWFYECRYKPAVYMAAAPPVENLKDILWAELISAVSDKQDDRLINDSVITTLRIERSKKEKIRGLTIPQSGSDAMKEASFSGKHAPSQLFIFDEGDAVPDACYYGAETCQSGGFDRMLIIFNPRERKGEVYRMIKSGQCNVVKLSAFNHPSVIDGVDYWPGSVNREKTVARISEMCRPMADGEPTDSGCFKLPDFLVGCVPKNKRGGKKDPLKAGWYKILDQRFSHVVLGEYPSQSDRQLISEEWIDKARSRYDLYTAKHGVTVPQSIKCRCGLDIAEGQENSDLSVLAKRFGNFLHPLVTLDSMDVIEVGDKTVHDLKLNGITKLEVINCDGTGVGSGTAPYLIREYRLPAVKVMLGSGSTEPSDMGEFGLMSDQLLWAIRLWLKDDLAMLPPDDYLIEEMLSLEFWVDKRGKVKVSSTDDIKKKIQRSPDRLKALSLSFHSRGLFTGMDLT